MNNEPIWDKKLDELQTLEDLENFDMQKFVETHFAGEMISDVFLQQMRFFKKFFIREIRKQKDD